MSVRKLLGGAMWKGLLLTILLLLALLAAASLMLQRGLLPESAAPVIVCTVCAAAVFAGSRHAVQNGGGAPLGQALAVAAAFYAAMWLVALGGNSLCFSDHGLPLTASVLGGGLLSALCGRRKGKRQAGKRRAGESARAAVGKKRR